MVVPNRSKEVKKPEEVQTNETPPEDGLIQSDES